MNEIATQGHNNPPSPIDEVIAEYDGVITEAQNWADGEPVTDEAGMKAVDTVLKEFKTYKSALTKAGKEQTGPFHKRWKDEVAAVKVYTDDADLMQKALVAVVAPFKERLAAEKREAERKAWEETERLRKEAEAKAAAANAADIEAQREVEAAKQAAIDAEKAAKKTAKDKPKGMRTVTHYEVTDMRALVNFIAKNDKEAMAKFAEEYARQNHKSVDMDGVKVWQTKEAY
jgi:hypothetical protein